MLATCCRTVHLNSVISEYIGRVYVWVDPYIPLTCRITEEPEAADWVRFGDFDANLVELELRREDQLLAGLTIVSCSRTHQPLHNIPVVTDSIGLPSLA